jgi:hypothetical protein
MVGVMENRWQPIETAPRDGREILGVCGDMIRVCWPKLFPRPITPGDDMTDSRPGDRWEYFRDNEHAPGHTWSICPTHWMPLPLPPPAEAA